MRVELHFLTGRAHATPPDHAPAEGYVEWPPSPWRLLRALLATGYGKLGWTPEDPELEHWVAKLAEKPPRYLLPQQPRLSHLRQFVPTSRGQRSQAFDPFVVLRPTDRVYVEWPIELDERATARLDEALHILGYLGRSEAWVQGRRVEATSSHEGLWMHPAKTPIPPTGASHRMLLAPCTAPEHARRRHAALDLVHRSAETEGRSARRATQRLAQQYPSTLLEALSLAPAELRAGRWSEPPGSRWVDYDFPRDAEPQATHLSLSIPASPTRASVARYHRLPAARRPEDTLKAADASHRALARVSGIAIDEQARLLGLDARGEPLAGHRHLQWVPDIRGRRLVGFWAYVQAGWTEAMAVTTEAAWGAADCSPTATPFRSARRWRSLTPFLLNRHPHPHRDQPEQQLRRELELRGLPSPCRIRPWSTKEVRAARFYHYARTRDGKPPASLTPFGWDVELEAPIKGPLCLGYGAHRGLGVFVPEEDRDGDQNWK